jgi:hypothetical protein
MDTKRIRRILLIVLAAIVAFAVVAFAVDAYMQNPFSFQEKTTLGVRYQEYSPKSPDLRDNQRQVRIVLPGQGDSEVKWAVTSNTGCLVMTSTRALFNAKPIRVVDTATESEFLAGEPLFVSCIDDARIVFNRTIPLPAATPAPVDSNQ